MGIFADHAKNYWKHGLPAIPLLPSKKRPAVNAWQNFSDSMPTEGQQDAWLNAFPDGNIGLPLGPQSGLVAIDIDTDDVQVTKMLDQLLPKSPWIRIGKKGSVRIYKFRGEKTARIGTTSESLLEILSSGTQVVLPPSIHPDTLAPYQANANLWEVFKSAPELPMGFEDIVREMLRDLGYEIGTGRGGREHKVVNFVPAGQRDTSMVWFAGLQARGVIRGERSLLQALGEMTAWVENYVENVVGDPLDPVKAQRKVIEFVVKDVTGPRKLTLPMGWDEGLTDEMKEELGLSFTSENEKWTANRTLEYLQTEFSTHAEVLGDGQMKAIDTVLSRISHEDSGISVLDEERILKFIAAQTAGVLSMAALRRQLKTLKAGPIEGESHDEIAKVVHEHLNQFGEVRFDGGKFWQWKGSHWEHLDEDSIIRLVSNEFGHYPTCKRTNDYIAIARLLRSTAAKPLKQFDVVGVNFANGFLTGDLELMFHNPDYGQTYVLPYRYMPDEAGRMPMFNQFLSDSWGTDDDFEQKVMALQEAVGATLFGVAPRYQRAICLYGQAGSGKSTMSLIVRGMMPSQAISAIPPEKWDDTFLPAEMFGKLLNFAGELSEKKQIPGEKFKQIVEGEQTSAQYKNRDPFLFNPQCAHWFNSNHLPKSADSSEGFTRRWLFLEWGKSVEAEKRIVDLHNLISDREREAIVAWAVLGYARLRKNADYTMPGSHKVLAEQMAASNNVVRYFLAESPNLVLGSGETTLSDLYAEFQSFSIAMGVARRVSIDSFSKMIRDLQNTFKFKLENQKSGRGAQRVSVKSITVVN